MIYILISKWNKKTGFHRWAIPSGFAIKCAVGILFLSMYNPNKHLENDGAAFLYEGKILHDVFHESPTDYLKLLTGIGENREVVENRLGETTHWSIGEQRYLNDSKNVIRLHSIFRFFSSGNNYSVALTALIIFCLLGIIGTTLLTKAISPYSHANKYLIFGLLLLTPSILFWSSSILKEPLLIFGLGLSIYGLIGKKVKYRIVFLLFGTFTVLLFKSYILIFIFISIIFYWVNKLIPYLKIFGTFALLFALGLLATLLLQNTTKLYTEKISRKQFDFINIGKGGLHADADSCFFYFTHDQLHAFNIEKDSVLLIKKTHAMQAEYGSMETPVQVELLPQTKRWAIQYLNPKAKSLIEIPRITRPIDLVKNAPTAITNTLFRPYPWDPGSRLNSIAVLENIFLFILLFFLVKNRSSINKDQWRIIGSISFSLIILALFIGWITPVIGAIIRYRIPIQVGLILIFAIVYKPQKRKSNE
ncbi:MAG: hypothetical protein MK066_01725 [Crocinitomicaceae bacterium]|nr:hypothetical protein [Crocinitomicaceae bacterium]